MKAKTVQIRATKAERTLWQAAADREGITLSEWIRRACKQEKQQ